METLTLREELTARQTLPPPTMRKAIREAAGVTVAQVAREIGVTRQAVVFWERGLRRPSGPYLGAYLGVLELLRDAIEARE